MSAVARKPDWIRVRAPGGEDFARTKRLIHSLGLATVCEEAACPNIGECWSKSHATVMIMGDICTRACAFCNVATGKPRALDPTEPMRVAEAAAELGLKHIVITSVDRDDLADGGAGHFVAVVDAVRDKAPQTSIEILTPDFRNKSSALEIIAAVRVDIFNHNLETVPRLYRTIRPGARYGGSLDLLREMKKHRPDLFTKSGLMVGLGETKDEILQVMDDMRAAQVDFITIGQYLRPTLKHAEVVRYVRPQEFEDYADHARAKGFLMVASSPMTRSSYHAEDHFHQLRAARSAEARSAEARSAEARNTRH